MLTTWPSSNYKEEKKNQYSKPQWLYQSSNVYEKKLRQQIIETS